MKKSKRILSMLTALAMTASAFASMALPASAAETELFSYDFESGSPWAISYGGSYEIVNNTFESVTGVTGKVYDLRSNAEIKGGRNATLTMPEAKSADYMKLTFDWFTNNSNRNNGDDLTFEDSNGNKIFTVGDRGQKVVIGSTTTELDFNQWYTIEAVLDFNTKQVITATASQNNEVKATVKHIPFESAAADDLGKLYVNFYRSSGNNSDAGSGMMIDNFTGASVTDVYKTVTLTVSKGGTATADADVTFDGTSGFKTDANGQIKFGVADGTYAYEVSAAGCEDASGNATATGSVTVSGTDATEPVEYGLKTYTAVPTTVNVISGSRSMTAPRTAETATSEAYTVEVFDQETLPIDDADIVWSIAPTDEKVSINATTGVVTVAKGFDGGASHVKDFTVKATVTKNSQSKEATRALKVSDYLFYESGIDGSSYGTTEAHEVSGTNYITTGSTKNSTATITLPEPITFTAGTAETVTFDVAMIKQNVYTFKRNISIVGTGKDDKDNTVDKTIASVDFVNYDIGTDATWSSSNSTLGTTWGSVGSLNNWTNISILFATYQNGETRATLTIGENEVDLGTVDADNITKITLNVGDCGGGTDRYVAMKDIIVKAEDAAALDISGSRNFTSIPDNTITKDYEVLALMFEEGETFEWSTTIPNATITVDPADSKKAVLTVPDTVTAGGKIKVTSSKSREAEADITIAKAVVTSYDLEGTTTVHYKDDATAAYTLTNVKDQNGDDITEYVNPKWSLKGRDAVTLPKATFTVDASAVGDAVAIFPTYEGTALKSVETAPIKITAAGDVEIEGKNGQKVFLWDSLSGIKPLAAAQTITGDDVDSVNYITNTGVLNVHEKQNETVVATVLDNQTAEKDVKIDTFYLTDEPAIVDNKVDISALVTDDAITGYQVTTVKAGNVATAVVDKASVTDNKISVTEGLDLDDGDEFEIAPVYSLAENASAVMPDDAYNIIVTATAGSEGARRTDVYINDQMIINNLNQGSDGFKVSGSIPSPADYTVKDVVIAGGSAKLDLSHDNAKNGNKKTDVVVKIAKSPSIIDRVKKIYVLGDSLVAKYYDHENPKLYTVTGQDSDGKDIWTATADGDPKLVREGWGEALKDYVQNAEVVNLGNSGVTAEGLLGSAFTNVRESAQKGDIMILESGYNDKTYTTVDKMKAAVKQMVTEAEAMGLTVFVVTPNATIHSGGEYAGAVQWASYMRETVSELRADGSSAILIDLAADSSAYLQNRFGEAIKTTDDKGNVTYSIPAGVSDKVYPVYNNVGDKLHSTLNAANCWAAIVAKGLYDNNSTRSLVDTSISYTFTDSEGEVVVNPLTIVPAAK